jgi:hypothetical protein
VNVVRGQYGSDVLDFCGRVKRPREKDGVHATNLLAESGETRLLVGRNARLDDGSESTVHNLIEVV